MTGGWGPAQQNVRQWGGGILRFLVGEGAPTPSMRYPTPLDRDRRGGGFTPYRRTLHAKHTFWDWNHGGGSPLFYAEQGGRGSGMGKRKPGGGGQLKFRRGPLPFCERGGGRGSWAGILLGIADLGGRSFFEILSNLIKLFPEFSAFQSIFFCNCRLVTRSFFTIFSNPIDLFL